MAETISLEDLIGHLNTFDKRTTEQCIQMMQEEVPVGRTGQLLESIGILEQSRGSVTIGSNLEYASAVQNGRPGVHAKRAKALHWVEYVGGPNSIHTADKMWAGAGEDVFAYSVGPTEPNDFIGRTKDKILAADLDIIRGFRWTRKVARAVRGVASRLWNR